MLGLKTKEICNSHPLKAETRKQIEDRTNIGYSYVKLAGVPGVARRPHPPRPLNRPPLPFRPVSVPSPSRPVSVPSHPRPVPSRPRALPGVARRRLSTGHLWPGHLLYSGQPYAGEWTKWGSISKRSILIFNSLGGATNKQIWSPNPVGSILQVQLTCGRPLRGLLGK